MADNLESFDRSSLGAFVKSDLEARNGSLGEDMTPDIPTAPATCVPPHTELPVYWKVEISGFDNSQIITIAEVGGVNIDIGQVGDWLNGTHVLGRQGACFWQVSKYFGEYGIYISMSFNQLNSPSGLQDQVTVYLTKALTGPFSVHQSFVAVATYTPPPPWTAAGRDLSELAVDGSNMAWPLRAGTEWLSGYSEFAWTGEESVVYPPTIAVSADEGP